MSHPLKKVTYILLHFPYLTETFVAEEIHAIRSQGIEIDIVSLLEPGPGPVQPLSQELLPYAWHAPGLLSMGLWKAQLYYLLKSPLLYLQLLIQLLRQPYPKTPLILLAKRGVIFLKAIAAAHYLKDSDTQLLHTHFAWLSGAGTWICSRLLDLPFTVTVHAYDIYFSNDLLALVSEHAKHIMAISEYNRQQVMTVNHNTSDSISIVHCGVNLTKIEDIPPVQHQSHDTIKIISVGSLVPKKGHHHLITACYLLKKQGVNFTCTIIGGGPQERILKKRIEDYQLEDQVKLLGARPHPEIIAAYQESDIFALACIVTAGGDRDGIPVVLMEAGALGLPLISTQVSGIPELVQDNHTGLLVPPGDPEALAEAIIKLGQEPELRTQLGQNARKLVRSEFEIAGNANRMKALFQKIYHHEQ